MFDCPVRANGSAAGCVLDMTSLWCVTLSVVRVPILRPFDLFYIFSPRVVVVKRESPITSNAQENDLFRSGARPLAPQGVKMEWDLAIERHGKHVCIHQFTTSSYVADGELAYCRGPPCTVAPTFPAFRIFQLKQMCRLA